jgi:hypothetical protein
MRAASHDTAIQFRGPLELLGAICHQTSRQPEEGMPSRRRTPGYGVRRSALNHGRRTENWALKTAHRNLRTEICALKVARSNLNEDPWTPP